MDKYKKINISDIANLFKLTGNKENELKQVIYTDKQGTTHKITDIKHLSLYFGEVNENE